MSWNDPYKSIPLVVSIEGIPAFIPAFATEQQQEDPGNMGLAFFLRYPLPKIVFTVLLLVSR